MLKTKFCKDCKFYIAPEMEKVILWIKYSTEAKCSRTTVNGIDTNLVTGESKIYSFGPVSCEYERSTSRFSNEGQCGIDGRYFEERE